MMAGPVTILGECFDDGATRNGLIRIITSSGGTQLSTIIHTGPADTVVGDKREISAIDDFSIMGASSSTPFQRMGTFIFHHPASNTHRSATMFISLNFPGDCAFAITAFE